MSSFILVAGLTRIIKILLFVLFSLALHLTIVFVDISERPVLRQVRKVGIGLVQRSSDVFSSVKQEVRRSGDQSVPIAAGNAVISTPSRAVVPKKTTPVVNPEPQPISRKPEAVVDTRKKVSQLKNAALEATDLHTAVEKKTIMPAPPAAVAEIISTIEEAGADSGAMLDDTDSFTKSVSVGSSIASIGNLSVGGEPVSGTQGFQDALARYDLNPYPKYPEIARRRGLEGTVLLEILVSAKGRVDNITLSQSSGYRSLDRAATKAVQRWQFDPASSAGLAVASRVAVPIKFMLTDD